jgi:hypothetical protein
MIRVILQGRTGNNLFQYAAGRALAIKHNTDLILDGAWSNGHITKQFKHLIRLPIKASYVRHNSAMKRLLAKTTAITPRTFHHGPIYHESSPTYDKKFHDTPDQSLLMGFFQSPNYFSGIEAQLRKELDLSMIDIPDVSKRFEDDLRSKLTTSIHVRRGDYLAIGATQCLDANYYEQAIDWFRERYEGMRFCLFSDDIPWCRNRFIGDEFIFSDFPAEAEDPLHDLRLMSACHHHVIVNSSYSWWGAWLNSSTAKKILAPTHWMKDYSSINIYPSDWIRI